MRDPINPADIRVGDRVERVYVRDGNETIDRFTVAEVYPGVIRNGNGIGWRTDRCRVGTAEWYLLDRPDPLAEAVEVAAKAQWVQDGEKVADWDGLSVSASEYLIDARVVVAAIAERWELGAKNV